MFRATSFKFVAAVVITFFCLLPLTRAQFTDPSEVTALKAIKRNLNDHVGYLNWSNGDPCTSKWRGVFCYNTTAEDGFLHVHELQLLNMNLSGSLVPELGELLRMQILNIMWNRITGSIPKEIGKMISLKLMLLSGNLLSGSLPKEIGDLSKLERIQIDQNQISGSLPISFANLRNVKHFYMNNNTISGQIPSEFSQLRSIMHILLDNNNLTGYLPEEFSELPNLLILQLDNNNFREASIPSSYGNMRKLLKLSLRNCRLRGPIPDLSRISQLLYLDLSWNQLTGSAPFNRLSTNITTIDLSNNKLSGFVSSNFSNLPRLQRLLLNNNHFSGSVPSTIWQGASPSTNGSAILNFQNNNLTNISGDGNPPENFIILLQGNPLCENSASKFCSSQSIEQEPAISPRSASGCRPDLCPLDSFYEYNHAYPEPCKCAAPIRVGFRLKSPGFSDFRSYILDFEKYLSSGLNLNIYQLNIDSVIWEEGPRLRMHLMFFPNSSSIFVGSEILEIRSMLTSWEIPDSDIFGPYELLNFTLLGPYEDVILHKGTSTKLSKGVLIGTIFGVIAAAFTCMIAIFILIFRMKPRCQKIVSRKCESSRIKLQIEDIKDFNIEELSRATKKFSKSSLLGQGSYGKVYKGILVDGTEVAIKRAESNSLQGSNEFFTEIELLSKLHHRNLVSLIGYCDEENEQLLVYEFMKNGNLADNLSAKTEEPLSYSMRLRIAMDAAKGIHYLHTEVDPPIFHRDIKASNILLDSKFTAKVADFGISRVAPELNGDGSGSDHITTVVKGTPGYLDPEYFLTHKLTDKVDVYSLGIVFLELLTGKLPISHGRNIVREVNTAWQSGKLLSVIDKRMGDAPSESIERFIALAISCCQDEADARPSIIEVVKELENIRLMTSSGPAIEYKVTTDTEPVITTSSS